MHGREKGKKYDRETGEVSTAPNAVTLTFWFKNGGRLDSKTGEPSKAADAVTYAHWHQHQLVSLATGKRCAADAADAVTYKYWQGQQPHKKKPTLSNWQFYNRQTVDEKTGKPSEFGITRNAYRLRRAKLRRRQAAKEDALSSSGPSSEPIIMSDDSPPLETNSAVVLNIGTRTLKRKHESLEEAQVTKSQPQKKQRGVVQENTIDMRPEDWDGTAEIIEASLQFTVDPAMDVGSADFFATEPQPSQEEPGLYTFGRFAFYKSEQALDEDDQAMPISPSVYPS